MKTVLVHGTEGHLIADILKNENVSVIAGPVLCDRCKPEMNRLELKNPGIMSGEGIRTCICTDHPETPVQYLPLSALAAIKGGMKYDSALEAITSNAADAAGIGDKTGRIKEGLDADIQLYHGDPLDFMEEPVLVLINGINVLEKNQNEIF